MGVDHEVLGQEVKAFVVAAPGQTIDPDQLARFAAQTLSPIKVPAHWEIYPEALPRNAAGKVLKNVLAGDGSSDLIDE